jgi:hypothetical protein
MEKEKEVEEQYEEDEEYGEDDEDDVVVEVLDYAKRKVADLAHSFSRFFQLISVPNI